MATISSRQFLYYYFSFSFFSSLLTWAALLGVQGPRSLDHSFFLSILVVTSGWAWIHSAERSLESEEERRRPTCLAVLLVQTLAFCGMAIDMHRSEFGLLAMVPSIIPMIVGQTRELKRKGLGLLVVALAWQCVGWASNPSGSMWMASIWGAAFVATFYFSSVQRHETVVAKWLGAKAEAPEHAREDRLFYHDLINQTHSVLLFLNHKQAMAESIDVDDARLLAKEILLLQSLIHDHTKLKHKNLKEQRAVVSLAMVRDELETLVERYLPRGAVKTQTEYSGRLQDVYIHEASLFRIVTNVIKNISESGSKHVRLAFNAEEEGVYISVRNHIFALHQDRGRLNERLSSMILSGGENTKEKRSGSGLGLESIAHLTESLGGQFNFAVVGEYWQTDIFLPNTKFVSKQAA